jgi:energy-coupling factor transport system ATP-binding protein
MIERATTIHLEHLSYRYRPKDASAIHDVSWSIEDGSFVVVTGPSGSGKSTLLRSLNGLVPHFSGGHFGGNVVVSGENTRQYPTRAFSRFAGFVFQDPDAQAVSGRVDDEIAFGLEQLGIPRSTMLRRIEETLDLLGIANLRARDVATLSGGERQRVAIAASLAMGPRILVLDEPTSQLDPGAADDLILTLHRLNEEQALTIVLAEHRLERVLQYADVLRVLTRAECVAEGPPRTVLEQTDPALLPPVSRLGRSLGWSPLPVSVKEGRLAARARAFEPPPASVDAERPGAPPVIRLQTRRLGYDEQVVLRDVEFDARPGEIVALMGRNGSGKTTLLRALVGLHAVGDGMVTFRGREIRGMESSHLAQRIGYLPQRGRTLLFHERVDDEVAFTLRRRGADVASVDHVLDEFDLTGLEHRHPHSLSVGEQERLALAVTLGGNPDAILLDEPTRGLDAARKMALAASLRSRSRAGAAIVLATHDVELVASIATRVVLLGHQEIIAAGSPRETMAESLAYSPQMQKIFGPGYLTVADVVGSER